MYHRSLGDQIADPLKTSRTGLISTVPSPLYNEQDASRTCKDIRHSAIGLKWDNRGAEELGVASVHAQIVIGGRGWAQEFYKERQVMHTAIVRPRELGEEVGTRI